MSCGYFNLENGVRNHCGRRVKVQYSAERGRKTNVPDGMDANSDAGGVENIMDGGCSFQD